MADVKFTSNKDEVMADVKDRISRALETCGGTAERYAKEICPVRTGNLRNSINHASRSDTEEAVATNVEYAPFVELGHHQEPGRYVPAIGKRLKRSFVPGKPFLRPAVEDHQDEYARIIQQELQL